MSNKIFTEMNISHECTHLCEQIIYVNKEFTEINNGIKLNEILEPE